MGRLARVVSFRLQVVIEDHMTGYNLEDELLGEILETSFGLLEIRGGGIGGVRLLLESLSLAEVRERARDEYLRGEG